MKNIVHQLDQVSHWYQFTLNGHLCMLYEVDAFHMKLKLVRKLNMHASICWSRDLKGQVCTRIACDCMGPVWEDWPGLGAHKISDRKDMRWRRFGDPSRVCLNFFSFFLQLQKLFTCGGGKIRIYQRFFSAAESQKSRKFFPQLKLSERPRRCALTQKTAV